jgi:hypothetical protein
LTRQPFSCHDRGGAIPPRFIFGDRTHDKIQYLRLLHDIAYQANLADTSSADAWQTPEMAATHCQPVLDIACSMLTPAQYQAFLDCFGDFASFAALLEGADA